MPTYEYACKSCGEHLEVVQSFTDEPLTACPNCGGDLRKVFGNIGIVFKGSGFYKTDSRANGTGAVGDVKAGGEPKKSDTTASESKSTDSKSTETKSTDSKSSDSKGSGTKSSSPASAGAAAAS